MESWWKDLEPRFNQFIKEEKIKLEELKIEIADLQKKNSELRINLLKVGVEPSKVKAKPVLEYKKPEINSTRVEFEEYSRVLKEGVGAYMEKLIRDSRVPCIKCESRDFTHPQNFNLMLKTFLGPAEEKANVVYFRPETAQAMFVNFKNVLDTSRKRLPFGIAQIGKAFRNEITPGNFIFRTREFEQMEIEYFVRPAEWEQQFEYWLGQMKQWVKDLGVADAKVHYVEIPEADRAHYSKRTVDIEYQYPFGQKELYGLAYRGSFDLDNHMKASGADLQYVDPQTSEKFVPHVIEPTWGVDRSVLVALLEAYTEDTANERTYLKLPYWTAPYKVAVFPLLANKPALVEKARAVYSLLSTVYSTAWDDRGNVGKRYYAQDEIGTPFCVTVDFETLGEEGSDPAKIDTVTVRNRDTMTQDRVKIGELQSYLADKLAKG
jgi:glycyl-tRNA synthetase